MKTKIFLAFIIVIFSALLSSFIFNWFIIKDFDNYVKGIKEDLFYWVKASVESSYSDGRWDKRLLTESIHWAMMIGLDIKILDINNREIITSEEVLRSLPDSMKKHMHEHFHTHITTGEFESHDILVEDKKNGKLLSRPYFKEDIQKKEYIFKKRLKNFLIVSVLIAGCGSLIIAMLLSQYLSKPIIKLRIAAEKIAKGDFDVKIEAKGNDEIGSLAESFDNMAESLRRGEKLRKHLMFNIAHELRTPLTIIKTQIEAVEDKIIEDQHAIENIKNETNKLIRLIKGIEDITTAEASFFTKKEGVEIDLKEFISELVYEMLPAFKDKGIELKVREKEGLIFNTDVEKLEIIMLNILSNSLKYTEKGEVWIDYGTKNGFAFIEINDTGKGIPENDIQYIFNRFYRVQFKDSEGLGLGLAIVKELIDVMNGKIEVKSQVGKGANFRIYLPMS